ncbi:unnamed protein product, partial [Thlaspi arvense]
SFPFNTATGKAGSASAKEVDGRCSGKEAKDESDEDMEKDPGREDMSAYIEKILISVRLALVNCFLDFAAHLEQIGAERSQSKRVGKMNIPTTTRKNH